MNLRGYTPELIPGVTPDDLVTVIDQLGWQRVRDYLGVADSTLEDWVRGIGLPQPRNQEKIRRLMTSVVEGKRLYRVRT